MTVLALKKFGEELLEIEHPWTFLFFKLSELEFMLKVGKVLNNKSAQETIPAVTLGLQTLTSPQINHLIVSMLNVGLFLNAVDFVKNMLFKSNLSAFKKHPTRAQSAVSELRWNTGGKQIYALQICTSAFQKLHQVEVVNVF